MVSALIGKSASFTYRYLYFRLHLTVSVMAMSSTIEIRGADEISEQVTSALGFTSEAGAASASSAAAANLHAKPTRPGRGRAKVSKFQSTDEDI